MKNRVNKPERVFDLIFWGNFLDFFGRIFFGRIFLGGFFLGGFFWEDFLGGFFGRIFLGGILCLHC